MVAVAFSGARRLDPAQAAQVTQLAPAFVPAGAEVLVGCASGVDALVRAIYPDARIFAVSSGRYGKGPAAFARRTGAMVQALRVADAGGLLVAFPARPCSDGIIPARSWRAGRPASGTWSAAALAAGLGCELVIVPLVPMKPPQWPGGAWVDAGISSALRWSLAPPAQLPLF